MVQRAQPSGSCGSRSVSYATPGTRSPAVTYGIRHSATGTELARKNPENQVRSSNESKLRSIGQTIPVQHRHRGVTLSVFKNYSARPPPSNVGVVFYSPTGTT